VIPLVLPPGKHDVAVSFPEVGGARQEWRGVVAPEWGQEATYYLRMQRYSDGPHYWPPGGMGREVARTGNEPGQ
jgi:hypothetical protein